ncbi:MAG: amidohydrolase family protein [Clostridiales Family XIII bacterium]|nr:amidohydrolase family protein [Clostridiales Family XIII bacterium]
MSKYLLTNAVIFTSDDRKPFADSVGIMGDRIVYVGNGDPDGAYADLLAEATKVDLERRMVVPGFCDSHIHPGMVSQSAWHIRLPWYDDPADVPKLLDFVKDYAQTHPKEEAPFLYFEYYPTSLFGDIGPTKELLDSAVSDRPCLLQDFGEHLAWVNSKCLECMGVNRDTPDPSELEAFVRYADGEPTGWVREMAHLHFFDNISKSIGWAPPMDMTPDTMEAFFSFLPENGITAIGEGILEEGQMEAMAELERQGRLYCYYDGCVRFWTLEDLPAKIAYLRELSAKYTSRHLKLNTMKLFLDGTNESGNSALLSPHIKDETGMNFGAIQMEEDELTECFSICNREGLDLHIHMVGDRAFHVGCNSMERARLIAEGEGIPWVCQPVFAHCELIAPEDRPRVKELGITINWSCHWAGGYFGEEARNFISEEKWDSMYDFTEIIESDALVAFSSDVVTMYELHRANPLFGMQVSHTRIDPEFPLDSERFPDSMRPRASARLPLDILLKGYTIGSARQMRRDGELGSITEGKIANLCVLSDNLFEVRDDGIKDIRFEAVLMDGEIVSGSLPSW